MDLNQRFTAFLEHCQPYQEALHIVQLNSRGKIWLIGGFVYRTLAHLQYDTQKPAVDLDFIVEHPTITRTLPEGWTEQKNRFGNPKWINGNQQIDYVPLTNIYMLQTRGLEPTIDNFLAHTPLSIQAIVFNIGEKKLQGERGLDALRRKVVEVLDLDMAKYAASKKGKSINEYILTLAENLGFTPIFPE